MQKIGIIGAGVMGLGIAQVAVQKGLEVVVFDLFAARPGSLKSAQNKLRRELYLEKNKDGRRRYTFAEADRLFSRVRFLETTPENLRALRGCSAVVEAIIEDIAAKRELYRMLEDNCVNEDTPIFTNTSTIQVERLADGMAHPERLMGLHFFNPVPRMRLIEAIPHRGTSQAIMDFAEKQLSPVLGKIYRLAPDIPGFVVNRLAVPMIRAGCREIEAGVSVEALDNAFQNGSWPDFSPARTIVQKFIDSAKMILHDQVGARVKLKPGEIDEIITLGLNFPIGPFALDAALEKGGAAGIKFPMGPGRFSDLVGIDVATHCCRMMDLQEPGRWPTPRILKKMVEEKRFGRKSGAGFYDDYAGNVRVRRVGQYAYVLYGGDVLSLALVQKLTATFEELGRDGALRGILFDIRAKGADLTEFPLCLNDRGNAEYAIEIWHRYIRALRESAVPITAFIRDYAYGGGYESALACDKILATEGSRIGLPEVGLGIMPGGGGTQNLTRRVGLARGTEMTLGAQVIRAKKPYVDVVIYAFDPKYILESDEIVHFAHLGDDKLIRRAHTVGVVEYAKYLFALAKVRIGWTLKGIYPPASFLLAQNALADGYQTDIEDGMWYEMDAVLKAFGTEDAREGICASPVFEKRKPRFTGK